MHLLCIKKWSALSSSLHFLTSCYRFFKFYIDILLQDKYCIIFSNLMQPALILLKTRDSPKRVASLKSAPDISSPIFVRILVLPLISKLLFIDIVMKYIVLLSKTYPSTSDHKPHIHFFSIRVFFIRFFNFFFLVLLFVLHNSPRMSVHSS